MRFWTTRYGCRNNKGHGSGYGYQRDVNISVSNYIEVYVNNASSESQSQGYAAPVSVSVVPSAPLASQIELDILVITAKVSKTPGVQLRELDSMKGMLSEAEYQAKRAEILSDV